MPRKCEKAGVTPFGFHAIRHLIATKLYHMGKPLGAIQAILRHKSAATSERYLKSLGLEETRIHLEALCDMRKPVKDDPGKAASSSPVERSVVASVINLKDHLKMRSQVVFEDKTDKPVQSSHQKLR